MAEEKKVNLNEKILCPKTGKELSGYKGEISIRPDFGDEACRIYSYFNVVFKCSGFEDKFEAIENFTSNNEVNIDELYPIIKAQIFSPFASEDQNTIILRDEDPEKYIRKNRSSLSVETDVLGDYLDYNEGESVYFYELYLNDGSGKFRGDMNINFEEIETYSDLLEEIEEEALLNYEFYNNPEDILKENVLCEGVLKNSDDDYNPDSADSYLFDTEYLLEQKNYKSIMPLFEQFKQKGFDLNSELDRSYSYELQHKLAPKLSKYLHMHDEDVNNMKSFINLMIKNEKDFGNMGEKILKLFS